VVYSLLVVMFPFNRLTEKNSVNRFSINQTETDKMAAKLVKSQHDPWKKFAKRGRGQGHVTLNLVLVGQMEWSDFLETKSTR